MAFALESFALLAHSHIGALWIYRTEDSGDDILSAGYFNYAGEPHLHVGDIIQANCNGVLFSVLVTAIDEDTGAVTVAGTSTLHPLLSGSIISGTVGPTDADEITIGDLVYTFVDTLATLGDVLIDGASLENLKAAIVADPDGEGTVFGTGTNANDEVIAGAIVTDDTLLLTSTNDAVRPIPFATDVSDYTISPFTE